jgi:hypothetical protein
VSSIERSGQQHKASHPGFTRAIVNHRQVLPEFLVSLIQLVDLLIRCRRRVDRSAGAQVGSEQPQGGAVAHGIVPAVAVMLTPFTLVASGTRGALPPGVEMG